MNVSPDRDLIERFVRNGGAGKPKYGQVTVCHDLEGKLVLGPDPEEYLAEIRKFGDAGFTHVYLHQIGPDQAGFLDFARKSILTRL